MFGSGSYVFTVFGVSLVELLKREKTANVSVPSFLERMMERIKKGKNDGSGAESTLPVLRGFTRPSDKSSAKTHILFCRCQS